MQSDGAYDDIINLEHPTSRRHPRMPISARAAQFAPFAALSGFGEAIRAAEDEPDASCDAEADDG